METIKAPEYEVSSPQTVADTEQPKVEVNIDQGGLLTTVSPSSTSTDQWRKFGEQFSEFFSQLPDYLGDFFSEYQRPLTTLALLLGGLVTVKVTLAVLDALNDIPLLSPTFELVGIGYSAWFVYRYLLRAETRRELSQEFTTLKGQVVGQDSVNS